MSTRKDKILYEKIKSSGLEAKFIPQTFIWELITDCMEQYAQEQMVYNEPITIKEVANIKSKVESGNRTSICDHVWLYCGYHVWICDKEGCGKHKVE